jgi:hypothetical protein
LERLGRRVDSVVQPLSVCMLWCHNKGSALSDMVFQARTTLEQVEQFLETCAHADQSTQTKPYTDAEMIERLKECLDDISFVLQSLTMAMTTLSMLQQSSNVIAPTSPSALMRASNRLREMYGQGGDVLIVTGKLFKQHCRRMESTAAPPDVVLGDGNDDSAASRPASSTSDSNWESIDYPTLYNSTAPNASLVDDIKFAHATAAAAAAATVGATSSPVHVHEPKAQHSSLTDTTWELVFQSAALKLHSSPSKRLYELHIDSLDSKQSGAAQMTRFVLTERLGWHTTTAKQLGLATNTTSIASSVWRDDFAMVWHHEESNCDYAFVLDSVQSDVELRPIDVSYVVKLAHYDNDQISAHKDDNSVSSSLSAPPHVYASDEELWALLRSDMMQTPQHT